MTIGLLKNIPAAQKCLSNNLSTQQKKEKKKTPTRLQMNSSPLSAGKKWNQDKKKKEEVRYLVKYTGIGNKL